MARYTTRHEELRTVVIWDEAAGRAVRDERGPIVWGYSDVEFAEWFAGQLNQLRTVDEIRAGL